MDKTDMTAYGLHGQYEMSSPQYNIDSVLSQEKGLYCIIMVYSEKTGN